jgi:hypothetical protein
MQLAEAQVARIDGISENGVTTASANLQNMTCDYMARHNAGFRSPCHPFRRPRLAGGVFFDRPRAPRLVMSGHMQAGRSAAT